MVKSITYDRWISRQSEFVDMSNIQNENDLKIRTYKFLGYTPTEKQMDILTTYYKVTKGKEEKIYERKIYYEDKHYYRETLNITYHLKNNESIVRAVVKYRSSVTGRFIKKPEGD